MRHTKMTLTGSVAMLALISTMFLMNIATPAYAHECPPGATTAVGSNGSITCVYTGFMTGGGKFNGMENSAPNPTNQTVLVHGFILHCNSSALPNELEVNWKDSSGVEHQFHLEMLYNSHCEMNPALGSPNPPTANFNTWVGNGTGSLDGQDGAFIYAIFTDQSQPAGTQAGGPGDWSTIVIYAPNGTLVLNVTDQLFGGAQQVHMCGGNC